MNGMSDARKMDIAALRQAIGRETTASDVVTAQICRALQATLDGDESAFADGDAAPLAIHWCLAQPAAPTRKLGPDGHPARGDFLPAVPLPRRMWAGGRLALRNALRVGDRIRRISRVEDVKLKEGRTGPLCFVTVSHVVSTPRGIAIEERQDIVYRQAEQVFAAKTPDSPAAATEAVRKPEWSRSLMADPVLLFRYSALTFNGHRIHYDRDYATREEGYPALVAHGPLQATLLLHLAGELRGAPKIFEFRGASPLFDGAAFTINASAGGDGLDLWVADRGGRRTMTASATW